MLYDNALSHLKDDLACSSDETARCVFLKKKKKQVKYQEDKLNKFKALSNFPFDKNFISDKVILVYNNNSVLL